MNYKLIIFNGVVLVAIVITFILNNNYNTEVTNMLFNIFCGMGWYVTIYNILKDKED